MNVDKLKQQCYDGYIKTNIFRANIIKNQTIIYFGGEQMNKNSL